MLKTKLTNLAKDKPVLILLLLILALGIFVRVYDFKEVGMWNDDTSTIPSGLLWFYEHDYYPGLAGQGEPALGNLLVGAGCMLSGTDFSDIEKITPMYYPNREWMLGKEITSSIRYCRIPSVLFGIILLIIIALMSLLMFDKYVSLFTTAFYAFYTPLIQLSTFIHVDIFAYVFIACSILFMYLFYTADKGSTKEKTFFALSVLFASMAFSTKLPNAVYVVFAFLLLAEKNLETLKLWIGKALDLSFIKKEETNPQPLIENLLVGLTVAATTMYVAFEFSFKNLIEVVTKYRTESSTDLATFSLNTKILNYLYNFFFSANILDIIIFLASVYILIKLIINFKDLTKSERLLLYIYGMFLAIGIMFETFKIVRVMLMFSFPVILTMGLTLSSRFSPIPQASRRTTALLLILAYTVAGFIFAFTVSPHFMSCNPALEYFTPDKCSHNYFFAATQQTAEKLNSIMGDNETFVNMEGIIFYYTRNEQGELNYQFKQAFRQQFGREPTIIDKIKYFYPMNRTIRYVLVNPSAEDEDPLVKDLVLKYEPNDIAYLKEWPAAHIYDLKSLKEKSR